MLYKTKTDKNEPKNKTKKENQTRKIKNKSPQTIPIFQNNPKHFEIIDNNAIILICAIFDNFKNH